MASWRNAAGQRIVAIMAMAGIIAGVAKPLAWRNGWRCLALYGNAMWLALAAANAAMAKWLMAQWLAGRRNGMAYQ